MHRACELVREKGVPSVSAARAQKFSEVRCVREGAKGRVCKQESERTGHGAWEKKCNVCKGNRAERAGKLERRWSVQDSERANLCKIVAQGGERQAGVQRSVQEAGGCCVC